MIRYTTPTNELRVKGIDLTEAEVYITYRQGSKVETFRPETVAFDGEDTELTVSLTQLQTAAFQVGSCNVQVNFILDGKRDATTVKTVAVGTNLLEEEL